MEIYIDLVGPITPFSFFGEKYFFTFMDRVRRKTETHIGTEKSE